MTDLGAWGRRTAIITDAVTWSYAELADRVRRRADRLLAQGLVPGQVVLVPEAPVLDLLTMQHALARLGCGLFPVSPRRPAAELAVLVRLAGVEWRWGPDPALAAGEGGRLVATGAGGRDPSACYLTSETEPPRLGDLAPGPAARGQGGSMPSTRSHVDPAPGACGYAGSAFLTRSGLNSATDPLTGADADHPVQTAPALIIETSGSSGTPKAVMLSPANVQASAQVTNELLGLGPGDAWLGCLPRCHVGGLMIGYRCALAGATLVAHPTFEAAAVARDLARRGVTHLSLVPPMLARLLAVMPAPPPELRAVLVGGQALSGTLARQALAAGWPLRLTYGMTETCSHIALSPTLTAVPPPGEVGPPLPGVEVRGHGTPDAPASLRIRGPQVMLGYADPDRQPGGGLQDSWFETSDLGFLTPVGDLTVVGRADQLLVIGGEAVLPSRVEERLLAAPGVSAAVVVGFADPVWGHRLVAAYTGDLAPGDLEAWCRRELPARERPRGFRRFTTLPVLASGKPDLRAIKDQLA